MVRTCHKVSIIVWIQLKWEELLMIYDQAFFSELQCYSVFTITTTSTKIGNGTVSPRIMRNSLMFQSGKWDSFRIVTCKVVAIKIKGGFHQEEELCKDGEDLKPECLHSRLVPCHMANSDRTFPSLSRCTCRSYQDHICNTEATSKLRNLVSVTMSSKLVPQ